MVKIAIIDDGLDYNRLDNTFVSHEYKVENSKVNMCCSKNHFSDSHGLMVASIINQLTICDCSIVSIKVKNEECGSCSDFITAFELCKELNIDIVNTSLGSCYSRDFKRIQSKVNNILNEKITIVAATNNAPIVTYPAYLDGVVGVRFNVRCTTGRNIFLEKSNYGINIESAPPKYIIDKFNTKMPLAMCNSFTAPVITSILSNIIAYNGRLSYSEVLESLKKQAYYIRKDDLSPIRLNFNNHEYI